MSPRPTDDQQHKKLDAAGNQGTAGRNCPTPPPPVLCRAAQHPESWNPRSWGQRGEARAPFWLLRGREMTPGHLHRASPRARGRPPPRHHGHESPRERSQQHGSRKWKQHKRLPSGTRTRTRDGHAHRVGEGYARQAGGAWKRHARPRPWARLCRGCSRAGLGAP